MLIKRIGTVVQYVLISGHTNPIIDKAKEMKETFGGHPVTMS